MTIENSFFNIIIFFCLVILGFVILTIICKEAGNICKFLVSCLGLIFEFILLIPILFYQKLRKIYVILRKFCKSLYWFTKRYFIKVKNKIIKLEEEENICPICLE
jgi:hypothetical protein